MHHRMVAMVKSLSFDRKETAGRKAQVRFLFATLKGMRGTS